MLQNLNLYSALMVDEEGATPPMNWMTTPFRRLTVQTRGNEDLI
jgi:hypothetical protein